MMASYLQSPAWTTNRTKTIRYVSGATDAEGLFKEKGFRLNVENKPEAPSGFVLSSSSIAENLEKNAVVGSLTAVDADPDERHSFALIEPEDSSSTDNDSFTISGKVLKSRQVLDFENKSIYASTSELRTRTS